MATIFHGICRSWNYSFRLRRCKLCCVLYPRQKFRHVTGAPLCTHATPSKEAPAFAVRIAIPSDYDNVMNFMRDTFLRYEPTMIYLGLSRKPSPALISIIHKHVRDGVTVIAESSDHSIAGVAVNTHLSSADIHKDLQLFKNSDCERTRDLISFTAYVTEQTNLWKKYGVSHIFECSYVSVDPKFQRSGIASKLIRESWCCARNCGAELFRIDCTSKYTAQIAHRFGWTCVWSVPYKQYFIEGRRIFKCIQPPHTEIKVYIDKIGRKVEPTDCANSVLMRSPQ